MDQLLEEEIEEFLLEEECIEIDSKEYTTSDYLSSSNLKKYFEDENEGAVGNHQYQSKKKKKKRMQTFRSKHVDVIPELTYAKESEVIHVAADDFKIVEKNQGKKKECWTNRLLDGKYYQLVLRENRGKEDNSEGVKALCVLCHPRKRMICGNKNSTGNFLRHIRLVHPDKMNEVTAYYKRSSLLQYQSKKKKKKRMQTFLSKHVDVIPELTYMKESEAIHVAAGDVKIIEENNGKQKEYWTNTNRLLDGKYYQLVHYENRENEDISEGVKALCVLCHPRKRIICGNKNSTGNFLRHIRLVHLDRMNEVTAYYKQNSLLLKNKEPKNIKNGKQQDNTLFFSKRSSKLSQKHFNRLLLKFVISNLHALDVVEEQPFRDLFQGTSLKILSKRTLTRIVIDAANEVKLKTCSQLENIAHVCTTADIWSVGAQSFFGVTCHWINEQKLNLESITLTCQRFRGTHDYKAIGDVLHSIHCSFGIENKVVGCVTDNGSNFVKAFNTYSENISTEEFHEFNNYEDEAYEDMFELEEVIFTEIDLQKFYNESPLNNVCDTFDNTNLPLHFRCAAHTLNLLGTTAFMKIIEKHEKLKKLHDSLITKCNTLWKLSRRPKTNEIIQQHIKRKLPYPTITRWNSLYKSLKVILEELPNLRFIYEKLKLDFYTKTEELYLRAYLVAMKPIAAALDKLQANACLGYLIPTIFGLQQKLQKLKFLKSDEIVCLLATGLYEYFLKYFHSFELLDINDKRVIYAILATFSIPKFKLKWARNHEEVAIIKRIVLHHIQEMKTFFYSNLSHTSSNNSTNEEDDDILSYVQGTKNQNNVLEIGFDDIELLTCMESHIMTYATSNNTNIELLNEFPFIKQLFIKYNCILPSSAPVERLFSFATFMNAPRRDNTSDVLFDKMLCLHGNQNLL